MLPSQKLHDKSSPGPCYTVFDLSPSIVARKSLLQVVSFNTAFNFKPCPNERTNSQHWDLLVLKMLDGVGSCVEVDAKQLPTM